MASVIRGDDNFDSGEVGLGSGQTWQSVSRSANVTYTNTTGNPIALVVSYTSQNQGQRCGFVVGGVTIYPTNGNGSFSTYGGGIMIIPTGSTYYWFPSGGSASSITTQELR